MLLIPVRGWLGESSKRGICHEQVAMRGLVEEDTKGAGAARVKPRQQVTPWGWEVGQTQL